MLDRILTQRQRAERRSRMADAVSKLLERKVRVEVAIRRVAAQHRVAEQTVRLACRENQIDLPRVKLKRSAMTVQTLRIVGELMKGRRDSDIAREFELSRERIGQIKRNATAAGLMEKSPKWYPEVVKAIFLLRQFPRPTDRNYQQGIAILKALVETKMPEKPAKQSEGLISALKRGARIAR
jgi:hypothetical protein